jgi:hypothetical protein
MGTGDEQPRPTLDDRLDQAAPVFCPATLLHMHKKRLAKAAFCA